MVQQKIEFGKCFLIVGILLTLIIISSVDCDERKNLAQDRIVYASDGGYKADGKLKTDSRSYSWIVMDLKKVIELESIELLIDASNRDRLANTFSVYMSSKFYPCEQKSPELRATWKLCRHFNVNFEEDDLVGISCNEPVQGQFLIITYGSPYAWNITQKHLSFENIRAHGRELTGSTVQGSLSLDQILQPVKKKMSELMPIRHAIVGGLSSLGILDKVNELVFVHGNSEALLWGPNKKVFMVATKVGKGRVITMGSDEFIFSHSDEADLSPELGNSLKIWKKLKTWSKYTNEEKYIDEDFEKGDLVIAGNTNSPSDQQVEKAISWLLSGDISMIVAVYPGHMPLDENSYLWKIYNVTGVYTTGSNHDLGNKIDLPTDEKPDFCGLSIETILRLSSESPILLKDCHEYVRDQMQMVIETLKKYKRLNLNLNLNLKESLVLFMAFLRKYDDYIRFNAPCEKRIMREEKEKKFFGTINAFLVYPFWYDSGYKAPGVSEFPGDFESSLEHPRKSVTITFTSLQLDVPETHHTGLYLPAGDTLTLEVKSNTAPIDKWAIRINCVTDNTADKEAWFRFPIVTTLHQLKHQKIYSAFGGVVMIESYSHNQNITITFHNAVRTALYNSRENNAENKFLNRKHLPAPWTELVGDSVVICLPTYYVRKFSGNDLVEIVKEGNDNSIKLGWYSVGFNWDERRRLRVVLDVQMRDMGHAHYPICVPIDDSYGNLKFEKKRKDKGAVFGILHEYNHLIDQDRWKFEHFGETTNNFLSALIYENLLDFNWEQNKFRIYHDEAIEITTKYLNEESYESIHHFTSLAFMYHIAKCYGWGLYQKVFKQYVTDNINPKDDQDKRDQMVILMSNVSGYNVKPIFDYWKIPLSDYVHSVTNKYPCVLPDDTFTQLSPSQVNNTLGQYESCSRSCPQKMNATFPDFDLKVPNTEVEEE